ERPEPKPEEPKPGEQQPPPKPEKAEPRNDAPGEQPHGELSQEQKQRILSQLQQLDQQLQKIRMISRPKPKSGERDCDAFDDCALLGVVRVGNGFGAGATARPGTGASDRRARQQFPRGPGG
ncbi:MAG: hypothetical protein WCR59_08780, partial [Planctomycetota bacterium]